jgi:hypothetical protein
VAGSVWKAWRVTCGVWQVVGGEQHMVAEIMTSVDIIV